MPLQARGSKVERKASDNLLSPIAYDDDASSIHSRSDQDSDSDDDQLQLRARNSHELRNADRLVLMEEEETDKLVTDTRKKEEKRRRGSGLSVPNPLSLLGGRGSMTSPFSPSPLSPNSSTVDLQADKRKRRRARRKAKKDRLIEAASHGEDGHLMYEIEEGGLKEGSSTGESSDRDDSDDMAGMMSHEKFRRPQMSWSRWIFIHASIAAGFIILALLAWNLSKRAPPGPPVASFVNKDHLVSNGTALFAPTTIIISLDGFRADFLQRGITPRLNAFVKEGVSPKYMLPSFPSVTFPNHYTLATGLYPESHGIVGNTFWDPDLKEEFYYTHPSQSLDPKWWGGEAFWTTAEQQGARAAIHMWPGSEAHVMHAKPSFIDKYNGQELLGNKVSRIMEYLDMPGKDDKTARVEDTRPQLIAAYVPNVDAYGHRYGPNSTEILEAISGVDNMLEGVFKGLEQRNLTHIVNVMVVSDHGMATTDTSRVLQLEDLVGPIEIEHTDGWPLVGLRPKNPSDEEQLYAQLKKKSVGAPFEVYARDKDMPERYHFSKNHRIAPVWIIPETGWAIVHKKEFNVAEAKAKGLAYQPHGLHGYDHEHPLMRAIFIARGPAFPHPSNSEIEVFQNIEVYNMLCDSLGLEPAPNNGTLRLPLKTVGIHKPEDTPEVPQDPVTTTKAPEKPTTSAKPQPTTTTASGSKEDSKKPDHPGEGGGDKPSHDDGGDKDEGEDDSSGNGLWSWIKHKVGSIWHKITGSR
uniref:Uncharacterized protein n=1 Tax=Bionectria ochroleuca TaxID=29856 RepID=A0A8H7NL24_BIOOC